MSETYLIGIAKQLLALGYQLTPNKGKQCLVKHWNKPSFLADGPKGTFAERWPARFGGYPTIGVRVDRGLTMIDLDVDDPIVEALLEEIMTIAPDVHARAPTRYGGGTHKMALIARTDAKSDEVKKPIRSHRWRRPEDGPEQHHIVEIFLSAADEDICRRQFGAYGAHTPGKIDYLWSEDIPALHLVTPAGLPLLTPKAAYAICDAFDRLAAAAGWVQLSTDKTSGNAAFLFTINEDTRFEVHNGGDEVTYAELCDMYVPDMDLRCSSSFHGDPGHNRTKCRVGAVKAMNGTIGVWDEEERVWYLPAPLSTDTVGQAIATWSAEHDTGESFFNATITAADFYAYMPEHKYIFAPLGTLWPAASVNTRLSRIGKLKPSTWLDINRHVEQMTWAPGEPVDIEGKLFADGGWIKRPGVCGFNLYKPPIVRRVAGDVALWRQHLERIYPDEVGHIEQWCAHRVQRPAEKVNHALVLGGNQGIGKDTLLAPLKHAVGPWNFNEVGPQQLLERFNGFLKAVVLRVSEARDLGEFNRYAFYNHTKSITAAPPDALRIDEKNRQEYYIPNVCGVVITLNERDSLYLPPDDRRHFVAWANASKEDADLNTEYWDRIWYWYAGDGLDVVATHLAELDLSGFNAKKPPPLTDGFHSIVNLSRAPEDADMSDVLEHMRWPDAVTVEDIKQRAWELQRHEFHQFLFDRRNARKFGFRFAACGYSPVRNLDAKDGLWVMAGKRQVIYAKDAELVGNRIRAAQNRAAAAPRGKMV